MNKIPYKTYRLLIILEPFSEKDSQKYQKGIRFFTQNLCRFATLENTKKHWLHNVLQHPKKRFKIPYKTCRLLILLGPFSQNGSGKYQKSIRFFTKSHRPFCIFLHFTIFAICRKAFSHSLLPLGQFCCILQFSLSVFLFLSFLFLLEIWPPSFLSPPPFSRRAGGSPPTCRQQGPPPLLD